MTSGDGILSVVFAFLAKFEALSSKLPTTLDRIEMDVAIDASRWIRIMVVMGSQVQHEAEYLRGGKVD